MRGRPWLSVCEMKNRDSKEGDVLHCSVYTDQLTHSPNRTLLELLMAMGQ